MRREIWRQFVGVIICDQFWHLWGFHQKSANTSLNVCLILQCLWANLYLRMHRDRYSTSWRRVNYVRKSQTILLRKKRYDFHSASVFNWKILLIFFFFFWLCWRLQEVFRTPLFNLFVTAQKKVLSKYFHRMFYFSILWRLHYCDFCF